MKLKSLITVCLVCMSLFQVNAQDTLDLKIRELFELMGTNEIFETAIDEMLDMQNHEEDSMSELIADEFRKKIKEKGFTKIYEKLIPIYKKHLTADEIDGLINFFKSEVGRSYIKKQPEILKESMNAGGEWGKEMGYEILEEINLTKSKGAEKFNVVLDQDCSLLKNGDFYYHLNDDIIVDVTRKGNKQIELTNGRETVYEIEWLSNNRYSMTPLNPQNDDSNFTLIVNIYEITSELYRYSATLEGAEMYLEGEVYMKN